MKTIWDFFFFFFKIFLSKILKKTFLTFPPKKFWKKHFWQQKNWKETKKKLKKILPLKRPPRIFGKITWCSGGGRHFKLCIEVPLDFWEEKKFQKFFFSIVCFSVKIFEKKIFDKKISKFFFPKKIFEKIFFCENFLTL